MRVFNALSAMVIPGKRVTEEDIQVLRAWLRNESNTNKELVAGLILHYALTVDKLKLRDDEMPYGAKETDAEGIRFDIDNMPEALLKILVLMPPFKCTVSVFY